MKDKNLIINQLKELGFNEYKAKVMLVLLDGKAMSASEIADKSKIIRSSIYDVLKLFVEKGYCNEIETNRIQLYQIIDPEIILDKIEREQIQSHNQKLTQLRDTFGTLKEIYRTGSAATSDQINVELIRGYNKHRVSKYMDMLKTAKHEICGMFRFKGMITEECNETTLNFMKNGGILRSIYHISLDFKISKGNKKTDAQPEDLIRVCEVFQKSGEQIRLSRLEIPNMTIIDRENVFINIDDRHIPKQSQADVIFRQSKFSQYMQDLFEYYWNDSITIEQYKNEINNKFPSGNTNHPL